MFDLNKQIIEILKFDNLYKHVNLKNFNNEEKELIKVISYHNQQFNFHNYYKINSNQNIFLNFNKIKKFFNFKYYLKIIFHIISIVLKKKKSFKNLNVDIIFFISMEPRSQKDIRPIINNFSKKIILIDKPYKTHQAYKKIYKQQKIINVRDYIELKAYFLSLVSSFKFLLKLKSTKKFLNTDIKFNIYYNFFLRTEVYKKIINNIKSKKVFIDRGDGICSNYFINEFKNYNSVNKIFSYSANGLALNNDLMFAHYLYSDLDYLFCYGKLDQIFIKKLFKKNNFKLLNIPKKIIPIGSIRNFSFKILKTRKIKIRRKQFNFLYIKSNPTIYDNLDDKCFEKFCLFINKNFPESQILVKEKLDGISKLNNLLVDKKIINKKNIYSSVDIVPEDLFQKADFVVGTSSAALAQAIYYNIPIISIDNKVVISSFVKFFCSIYIEKIDEIEKYKDKIIHVSNSNSLKNKWKKFIFKKTNKAPHLEILKILKKK